MRLFLLGANGRTGRELIRLALEGGNSVTALVRSRDRLSDIHHRNLTIHAGSACDTEILAARVLQCAVPRSIEAARRMEQIICAATVDWTIVRTGFLKNGIDGTCRTEVGSLPAEARAVSRTALARFLLSEIRQPCQVRKVVGLCGLVSMRYELSILTWLPMEL